MGDPTSSAPCRACFNDRGLRSYPTERALGATNSLSGPTPRKVFHDCLAGCGGYLAGLAGCL